MADPFKVTVTAPAGATSVATPNVPVNPRLVKVRVELATLLAVPTSSVRLVGLAEIEKSTICTLKVNEDAR
jgi:hypothetical protein